MNKVPMTGRGFARLEEELRRLKKVERPAIIRAIAAALDLLQSYGNCSTNDN